MQRARRRYISEAKSAGQGKGVPGVGSVTLEWVTMVDPTEEETAEPFEPSP